MKKIVMGMAFAAAAVTTGVQARDLGEIFEQCGLGAMIFPRSDAGAVSSNVIWDLGTTATSTNLSSPESCEGGKKKVAALIQSSYAQVTADIAKGHGDSLTALSTAAQCGVASESKFKSLVRYNYAQTVGQIGQTDMDKKEALYGATKESASAAGCMM